MGKTEWIEIFKEAGVRYVVPVAEHHDGFAMVPFPLGALLGQDVGRVGLVAFEFAARGSLDPLGRPTMGFHLWHF